MEISGYVVNRSEKIRQGLISLTYGKARFVVQDLPGFNDRRFRVQTGTAVVGSLDTAFIVEYDLEQRRDEVCRGGLATALCLENSIIVFSPEFPDKPALLTANMMSQVCGPNLPVPPRFATAAELARILAGLDRIENTKITTPGQREMLPVVHRNRQNQVRMNPMACTAKPMPEVNISKR